MQYLLIVIFIIVFAFFDLRLGYTSVFPVWKHVTYMFQHANLLHLALNSLSIYFLFVALERFIRPLVIFLIMFLSAFLVSFLCIYPQPVVGASGMAYTGFGILSLLFVKRQLKFKDKYSSVLFFINVGFALIIGFFNQHNAALLHLYAFIAGFILSAVLIKIKSFQ